MVFTPDAEMSLQSTAALVNSAHQPDTMTSIDQLREFVRRWEYTGAVRLDATELEEVRRMRPRLRRLWPAGQDPVDETVLVEEVNALLREFRALPQLVRHDRIDWHIHAVDHEAPLAVRIAVEAAMAMTDLIRGDELDRLRICADESCPNVVIDLSRNRSRRFCDAGCANRAHVAAYRARRRV